MYTKIIASYYCCCCCFVSFLLVFFLILNSVFFFFFLQIKLLHLHHLFRLLRKFKLLLLERLVFLLFYTFLSWVSRLLYSRTAQCYIWASCTHMPACQVSGRSMRNVEWSFLVFVISNGHQAGPAQHQIDCQHLISFIVGIVVLSLRRLSRAVLIFNCLTVAALTFPENFKFRIFPKPNNTIECV